jgi:hypothetical protein
MDRQDLHERLRELHRQLRQVDSVYEAERQSLQELMADIQELLEKNEGHDVPRYRRLRERLVRSVEQFEASHPTLTTLMGETIDTLAKMGI